MAPGEAFSVYITYPTNELRKFQCHSLPSALVARDQFQAGSLRGGRGRVGTLSFFVSFVSFVVEKRSH